MFQFPWGDLNAIKPHLDKHAWSIFQHFQIKPHLFDFSRREGARERLRLYVRKPASEHVWFTDFVTTPADLEVTLLFPSDIKLSVNTMRSLKQDPDPVSCHLTRL